MLLGQNSTLFVISRWQIPSRIFKVILYYFRVNDIFFIAWENNRCVSTLLGIFTGDMAVNTKDRFLPSWNKFFSLKILRQNFHARIILGRHFTHYLDLIVCTIQFSDRIFTCHTLLCCALFISKIVSHREKLKEIKTGRNK